MQSEVSATTMVLSGQQPDPQEASWEALDRQDWHLWILAILLMFVLGVSLLSFMFPTAFWFREELALRAPQRAFLGFCVLLGLALVYMLQRQATVRRLRRQLFEARAAVVDAERKAAVQTFLNLPGMSQFRDAVAMEYRRASASSASLEASGIPHKSYHCEPRRRAQRIASHWMRYVGISSRCEVVEAP